MRLKRTFAVWLIISGLLTPAGALSENEIKWNAHASFSDGRKFFTDGALVLDSRYTLGEQLPAKNLPEENVKRLLQAATDHEFGPGDLSKKDANYIAPKSIHLNGKYIDYFSKGPLKSSLRLRAKGPTDQILILDGNKIVGVMMPIKGPS